jgi:hypothetical protein
VDLVAEDRHEKHIFHLSMLPRWGAYALLFFDERNEFVAIVGILDSEPWAHVATSFKNYTNVQDLLVSECYDGEEYMRIDPCDRVTGDLLFGTNQSRFQLEKLLLMGRGLSLQLLVLDQGYEERRHSEKEHKMK